MNENICVVYTHSKLGDLIWQLPYIKSLSEFHKKKITLIVRASTQAKKILKDLDHFDTIEYKNIELIWSSGCDHELKLMEVDVSYSQMNDPKYLESIAEEVHAFNEAQENGEDMQDWIEKRREEDKDGSKPKIVGLLPDIEETTIH